MVLPTVVIPKWNVDTVIELIPKYALALSHSPCGLMILQVPSIGAESDAARDAAACEPPANSGDRP